MRRAENPPDSKSPVEFDAYSLNHAAFVGLNEVAWTLEFEQELSRRKVYVNKVIGKWRGGSKISKYILGIVSF